MSAHWLLLRADGYRVRERTVTSGIRSRTAKRIELGRRATLVGALKTTGSVYAEPFVRVRGRLAADGRVVLGAGSVIEGNLLAGLDVHLLPGAKVLGNVRCGADLHLHPDVVVRGRVIAQGDVVIHGPAKTGRIETGGRVNTLAWNEPAPSGEPVRTRPRRARPIPS